MKVYKILRMSSSGLAIIIIIAFALTACLAYQHLRLYKNKLLFLHSGILGLLVFLVALSSIIELACMTKKTTSHSADKYRTSAVYDMHNLAKTYSNGAYDEPQVQIQLNLDTCISNSDMSNSCEMLLKSNRLSQSKMLS